MTGDDAGFIVVIPVQRAGAQARRVYIHADAATAKIQVDDVARADPIATAPYLLCMCLAVVIGGPDRCRRYRNHMPVSKNFVDGARRLRERLADEGDREIDGRSGMWLALIADPHAVAVLSLAIDEAKAVFAAAHRAGAVLAGQELGIHAKRWQHFAPATASTFLGGYELHHAVRCWFDLAKAIWSDLTHDSVDAEGARVGKLFQDQGGK